MKLSPAFLAYKLSSAFSVLALENLPLSGTLELPVLYQTGSAATAHRVFLCTEEQIGSLSSLPKESSSLFLLCTEELPEELPAPVSIAVKSSVSAVFSFLQELFWTYDSWQKELMQARLDGKSIQHLLNLSLPVFAHPLMVVGMDFSIIAAASEEPSFFPEKVFGSLDATRPLLLSLTESSEYASVRDLDGWFRFPDHVTGLGSLCVNITQHGQSAYRLLLLDTKKDLCDAENLAGAVASHCAAPCPRRPDGRLYCGQPGSRCARLAFPPHLLLPLSVALRYGSEKPDGKLGLRLSGKYSDRLLRVSARRRYRCVL